MDKINSIGIAQTQSQLIQEMSRMASASGSSLNPMENALSLGSVSKHVEFSKVMNQAIDNVNQQQVFASAKQEAVEMGQSDDLMGAMLESQKASISFSAMMEVRNKLTSGLDQIMNISL